MSTKTESEALEDVRNAIQSWVDVQAREHPEAVPGGAIVGDFMVVVASQSFSDDSDVLTTSSCFVAHNQPRYRTLGLLSIAEEMVMDTDDDGI